MARKTKPRLISHKESKEKRLLDEEYARSFRLLTPRYMAIKKLVELRHSKNLTQADLAELAGTHQSRISKIESGEVDIQLSTLSELADAMGANLTIGFIPKEAQWDISETYSRVDEHFTIALKPAATRVIVHGPLGHVFGEFPRHYKVDYRYCFEELPQEQHGARQPVLIGK